MPSSVRGPVVGLGVQPLARRGRGSAACDRSYWPSSAPFGSSFLIARNAVGAVNIAFTPCSAITRQNCAGVRGADRLALVDDGRRADEQRRVDDVGVPDDPADVGRGEHRLARPDVVEVGHRPGQRHRVAAGVAQHALGLRRWCRRCTGCRAGRSPRRARARPARRSPIASAQSTSSGPISAVACGRCRMTRLLGRVLGQLDRLVEQGLVREHPLALDAAGRGRRSPSGWRRRSGSRARAARSRRTPPSARRRAGRTRASRSTASGTIGM